MDRTNLRSRYDAWVGGGAYSDEEASSFSGLPVRALRELQKLGALTPLSSRPGRGNRRLWDRAAIVRAGLTSAVMLGGYSLPVAARIALAWANSGSRKDAFDYVPDWDAIYATGSRRWAPSRADGSKIHAAWLSEAFAGGQIDNEADAYLEIIDGEHLIARTFSYDGDMLAAHVPESEDTGRVVRLGKLVDGGASILSADYIDAQRPLTPAQLALFDQKIDGESVREILGRFYVEGLHFLEGGGRYVDPQFLGLVEEEISEPIAPDATLEERKARIAGAKANEQARVTSIIGTAQTVLSINMTLAQRRVMRRAVGLTNGPHDPSPLIPEEDDS